MPKINKYVTYPVVVCNVQLSATRHLTCARHQTKQSEDMPAKLHVAREQRHLEILTGQLSNRFSTILKHFTLCDISDNYTVTSSIAEIG